MAPQYARSERMERPDPHAFGSLPQQTRDSVSQLARGLVGEGDRQDSVGRNASFMNEVGDSGGEDTSFARSRPSQDQQRTLEVVHRFSLFLVQLLQVCFR